MTTTAPPVLLRTQALADYVGVSRPTLSKQMMRLREGLETWVVPPAFELDDGSPVWTQDQAETIRELRYVPGWTARSGD